MSRDIKDAIIACKSAGIEIVMITGDYLITALNITKQIGITEKEVDKIITGNDFRKGIVKRRLDSKDFKHTPIFQNYSKTNLEIVAVYQKADVRIAMGLRGTLFAKEKASIVLKDDSFTSISLMMGVYIFPQSRMVLNFKWIPL